MNRRGFLQTFAGAVAVAATGIPVVTLLASAPALKARHLTTYSIYDDSIMHRIDVLIEGNQYHVDFTAPTEAPSEEILEQAVKVMTDMIEQKHGTKFALDVRSFGSDVRSANDWFRS